MELIVAGAILLFTVIPNNISSIKPHRLEPIVPSASSKAIIQTPTPSEKPKELITHKVRSGETMNSIANDEYGSSKYWTNLWNDNDSIKDPRIINAGLVLKIRNENPVKAEELTEKLAKAYEEITAPSPTPTDTPTPNQTATEITNRSPLPAGSFEDSYKQAGSRFGVPWEILYGIHMVETGLRDGNITSGYGSGAQGPMQFMPGTWAAYGIDGNGDGQIDINNAVDAIFGAANFMAKHGGVDAGLKSYGGDTQGIMNVARSRGWNQ